eukprot:10939246-Lingulodinium_polyedra.AAC.1
MCATTSPSATLSAVLSITRQRRRTRRRRSAHPNGSRTWTTAANAATANRLLGSGRRPSSKPLR